MTQLKATTQERTVVNRRDWSDLTAREIAEIALATAFMLSLIWLIWSQVQQNRTMSELQQQLGQLNQQVSTVGQQLNQHVQDQSTAEARRQSAPTVIVPPGASSITIPAPIITGGASGDTTGGADTSSQNGTSTSPTSATNGTGTGTSKGNGSTSNSGAGSATGTGRGTTP